MCSILITNINNNTTIQDANFFIKPRGPDCTTFSEHKNLKFIHNLLSITGELTPQPFVDKENEIVCLYNGEIYNWNEFSFDYKSDGECLIPLYKEYGPKFVKELDGEFAICIADFKNNQLILASDPFLTKPLWYTTKGNKFGISSYKSCLERLGFSSDRIKRFNPNTYTVFTLDSLTPLYSETIYDFDLKQHISNYDHWIEAYRQSVYKRAVNRVREKLFIGMSSGYDSGAIACELHHQHAPFKIYSVTTNENKNILKQRFEYVKETADITYLENCNEDFIQARQHLHFYVEPYIYEIYSQRSNYTEYVRLHDDGGANAMSLVCMNAKREDRKIYLSGQGADEIFADYGWQGKGKTKHSNFGGLFPNDLKSIFPWASFYGSSQISYLTKEEYVGGSYGIECRYPFLDKQVVQQFLWLKPELKNRHYKNVLHNYMKEHDFPFCENEKIGFWY